MSDPTVVYAVVDRITGEFYRNDKGRLMTYKTASTAKGQIPWNAEAIYCVVSVDLVPNAACKNSTMSEAKYADALQSYIKMKEKKADSEIKAATELKRKAGLKRQKNLHWWGGKPREIYADHCNDDAGGMDYVLFLQHKWQTILDELYNKQSHLADAYALIPDQFK